MEDMATPSPCGPPEPSSGETVSSDAPQSSQNQSCETTHESHDADITPDTACMSDVGSTIGTSSGQVQSAVGGHDPSGDGHDTVGMECGQEMKSSGPDTAAAHIGSGHVLVENSASSTDTNDLTQEQVYASSSAEHPSPQEQLKQPVTGDFIALSSPSKSSTPPAEDGPLSRRTHRSKKKKRSHRLKKRSSRELLSSGVAGGGGDGVGVAGAFGGGQSLSLGQSRNTSAQIESEISQIDSILKALNTGSFDTANMMQISQLTGSAPTTVRAQPQVPSSTTQGGLVGVRGQSVSSEQSHDSSTSDSVSSTDSSEDSMEEEDIPRRRGSGGGGGGGRVGEEGQRERMDDYQTYPRTKGETDYRDLPPVDKCDISFPENGRLLPIGKVSHHTEKLLVVESLPNTPPVDEGTVLWSKDKTSLAKVFETFGPVRRPFYSIRINSLDDLPSLGVAVGDMVYVVPADLSLTRYVFPQELMREKGSDASWKDDNEVPQELKDYSDDENEQKAKKGRGSRSNRQQQKSQSSPQKPSASSAPSSSAPLPKSSPVRRQPSVTYTSDPKMQQYFIRGPLPQPPVGHPQYYGYPPPPFPMHPPNVSSPPGPYPYPPPPPHSSVPPYLMRGAYPQPLIPGGQPHHAMPGQRPPMMPPPHLPPHHPY